MIKEFFSKIRDGFYNWCDRAGDWFVGKHDVPVVGGILLWFGDKLKKSYKYYKDMKDTDATEFFVEDNGDISFDGDPIDVNDTDAIDVDDDAEFEEDEAPVEEKPEEETKKTPKFQHDHSTWFTDVMDSIQAFFWDIGSKIHDFFKGIKNFFKPVDYYEVYGNINVA